MKISSSATLTLALALSAVGAGIATVQADGTDTTATCDQITSILQTGRPGTLSYQRMKDQYNRKCLTIKAGCPSQANMDMQSRNCTNAGLYSISYIDPSSCMQIRCSPTPASSSSSSSVASSSSAASQNGPCPNGNQLTSMALACKNNNQKFEYYNINGCRQVRCIQNVSSQGSCPSVVTMQNKASACKTEGQDYEYYTIGVCKMVRCLNEPVNPDTTCASDSAINAAGVRCKARGMSASVSADANGCRKVTCVSSASSTSATSSASSCPSNSQLDAGIRICKNSGMTGTTMPDKSGCLQVICQPIRN